MLLRLNNNTHTQATIVHDKLLLKINFYSLSMITHTQLLPTRNYWSRSTSAHTQLLLRLNKTDIYSFVNKVPYKERLYSLYTFFFHTLLVSMKNLYKEYLSVLTGHHHEIELRKNRYLFVCDTWPPIFCQPMPHYFDCVHDFGWVHAWFTFT